MPANVVLNILTAAIGGFGILTLLVFLQIPASFDLKTIIFIQLIFPRALDTPLSLLSPIGSFEVTTAVLLALIITKYGKNLKLIITIFSLFIFGTLVELAGKFLLYHPSPPKLFFRNTGILFPSTYIHTNYSFPSGHMFRTTFIVVLLLYLLIGKRGKLLPVITLLLFLSLMAVSRVYLGEHWVSDVIGGILLGVFVGTLSLWIIKNKQFSQKNKPQK